MSVSDWLVLVVEDEEDSAEVVSQIFEHYGSRLWVAGDGRQCLDILRDLKPTVIVMDLALPRLDGWQTLAAIRADPATAGIPVVAITAFDSFSVAHEAREAGFDGYFAKPIQVPSFVHELEAIVSRN